MKGLGRLTTRCFSANYQRIHQLLTESYAPSLLQMSDDSAKHGEARDSHFSLYIVSEKFAGKELIDRHREVKSMLRAQGVFGDIHAISLVTRTQDEHERAQHGNAQTCCQGKGPHHH